MAKKSKKRQDGDNGALIATVIAGGLGLLIGLFALGRRAGNSAADGGSTAADLSLDQPHHGPGDRAPTEFRPDATAAVDPRKREAFTPATLPNPNSAEPAM